MYACICVCTHIWRPREQCLVSFFLIYFLPCFLIQGLSLNVEWTNLVRLSVQQAQGCCGFALPALLQTCVVALYFLCGQWGSKLRRELYCLSHLFSPKHCALDSSISGTMRWEENNFYNSKDIKSHCMFKVDWSLLICNQWP